MKKTLGSKFVQFALIAVLGIVADQWTKSYAQERLASNVYKHDVTLTVPDSAAGKTLREYLGEEFTWNQSDQLAQIALGGVRDHERRRVAPSATLTAGQVLHVTQRDAVIIPDIFDFQYARNYGSAFGFMNNPDLPYRAHFFVAVSLIALAIIGYILLGITTQQRLFLWGLSMLAAGAVGNFIDRIRLGYVVDFILWKYTDELRWPNFNIADALICVGVGLMFIEILRDMLEEQRELQAAREQR